MSEIKALKPDDLHITDIKGLFGVIDTLERTLITRYEQLAQELGANGNEKGQVTFQFLAEAVRRERAQLEALAIELGVGSFDGETTAIDVRQMTFPVALARENLDEAGGVYLMSPLTIISLAVAAEEEIFALFADLPGLSEMEDLRGPAEAIAKLKLDHLATLRLERRRAYRLADREEDTNAPVVSDIHDLNQIIGQKYARLCWDDAGAADVLLSLGDEENAAFLKSLADEDRELAGPPDVSWQADDVNPESSTDAILRDGLLRSEKLFQFFADVAEKSPNEDVVARAQEIAERQITRLVRFKNHLAT